MLYEDDVLRPGQVVTIIQSVTLVYEVDIEAFLAGSEETEITVEVLKSDIQDNFDLSDILEEYDVEVDTNEVEAASVSTPNN
jgi:hypothetical protein